MFLILCNKVVESIYVDWLVMAVISFTQKKVDQDTGDGKVFYFPKRCVLLNTDLMVKSTESCFK